LLDPKELKTSNQTTENEDSKEPMANKDAIDNPKHPNDLPTNGPLSTLSLEQ